ncbi:uncharacterized protein LOC125480569 [Pyrus x bretschneideri]|uniref:uncharacterized protein LOC125480569 n=1 Tax=Pyrus x bretschneideri TaxID=225117 RepID=UPI00202F5795|nr:uncharacterized protein LOC125480569 [Pyrus x bretschneideri]
MGYLHLSRGLTQGDPLCPYLFLHAEGLSTLLAHKEVESHLHSVAISQHAPSISHPHFADDSLLYATASTSLSAASWTCCENMRRHRDKKLTSWTCCKIMSAATSWIGMINTLGFQRLWAITKVFVSAISKRDYGRGYRNGRANYSVSRGMNSLSKLLPNQSRYTRCIVSSFRSIFVMILTALLLISGGVGLQTLRRFIGSLGRSFASLKKKVGSGFRNLYAFNLSFLEKQGWKSIYHAAHFVYDLIDDSRNWNVSLLKFLFSDVETNCILSLPLSLRKPDDCDNKGNFSVKNADQVAQDWLASCRDRASLSPTPNTFGRKYGLQIKVPHNKNEDCGLENWPGHYPNPVTQLSTSCVIVLSLDVSGLPLLLATHPVLRLNQRFSSGVPAVPHI